MAGNKLSVAILKPAAGAIKAQSASIIFKTIIKVTRENQVLYRSTPKPTGTLPQFQYVAFGQIFVSPELPFNGTEKLTIIYKDLIQ